jgi:alpha-mannosidase
MNRRTFVFLAFGLLLTCDAVGAEVNAGTDAPRDSADSPLYLLTYDHGGLVLWGRDHFVKYLHSAVDWLDRYPSFKIGLDNEAYTYDQLAEQDPTVLEEIRGYLSKYKGRFGIGTCTYGQPLSVFVNEESNIRQIEYALAADRKYFGTAPDVYLMSEHAMHAQIPQLIQGFGFHGAIMRTHYMMYGYNPTFDVPIGWWVGPDGSRVATIPTYKGEGAQFGRTTVDNWILTRYPSPDARQSPSDFRKEFSRIRPLLASRADDAGLRKEELVKECEGKPSFQWILLEELLPLFPAPREELRTGANDFVVRMPWGYCGNEIWNQSRRAEVGVLMAERIAAMASLAGADGCETELDKAWKDLLVAQHHDIQICGLLPDARKFLSESIRVSQDITTKSLQRVASRMASGGFQQLAVFNPVSWRRQSWIEVPVALERGYAKNLEIRHEGKIVPTTILSADSYSDGSLREIKLAVLADLDGLSVGAFELRPTPAGSAAASGPGVMHVDSENLTLTTPFWEVRLHPEGGLSSIQDRRTREEFLRPQAPSGLFAGKIDGRDTTSKGRWALEAGRSGAAWAVARQSGLIGTIPYTLEMKFYRENPRIDCWTRFRFSGERIGRVTDNVRDPVSGFVHEDKLRFKVFPSLSEKAVGVRDLPFAVSETADPYVNGLYWTAVADEAKGIAVFNRGAMGAVREKDGGFSIPLAYAAYYVWGTRMLSGDFEYEFALYPFSGRWAAADLPRHALEYNFPLVGVAAPGANGSLGATFQPVRVQSSDAVVSALYRRNGMTYVRVHDYRGVESKVTLGFAMDPPHVTEVDLAGRDLGDLTSMVSVKPWEIKTLRLVLRLHAQGGTL